MKKYKSIKLYAYRHNNGATGGPGGVLYLQKKILGDWFNEIPLKYFFSKKTSTGIFKKNYKGAIATVFLNELFSFNDYYICHEIASAFALALLNKPYSLIYHQQGPIIEELTNFKNKFKFLEKFCLKLIEKIAFKKAKSLHFPSKGAQDMYFKSKYKNINIENVNIGEVLPNTIEDNPIEQEMFDKFYTKDPSKLTFLSVGSLTKAKGQDQIMEFLSCFLIKYKQPVKFILVGKGPLKDSILQQAKSLERKHTHFEFIYRENLSHEQILMLNKVSDVYIMLHRISIFDLATLEAMNNDNAIILSNVGGNLDFNVKDNIILVDMENYKIAVEKLIDADIDKMKKNNKEVFEEYFSQKCFKNTYTNLFSKILN